MCARVKARYSRERVSSMSSAFSSSGSAKSWGAGSPMAASAEPADTGDVDGLGALSGDVIALSSTHVRSVQANDDARRREAALTTLASRGQSPSELAVRLRAPSVLHAAS